MSDSHALFVGERFRAPGSYDESHRQAADRALLYAMRRGHHAVSLKLSQYKPRFFTAEIACLRPPVACLRALHRQAFATQTGADSHRQAESAEPEPRSRSLGHARKQTVPTRKNPRFWNHWKSLILLCVLRGPAPGRDCGQTETFGIKKGGNMTTHHGATSSHDHHHGHGGPPTQVLKEEHELILRALI